ncbi:MAG: helix-turn-helix domain-containing protein [Clostridiales bacterium]|nr:helix-turn-helix domain-containing protein [Clostridiales bacterium]
MNLNMDLIADALRRDHEIVKEDAYGEDLTLEQARLFTGNNVFQPGILYIAEGESLPAKPFFEGPCGIVSIGPSDKCYAASSCDYLEIEKGAAVEGVLNLIQEAYKEYNKWYLDMYEALSNEAGIQALLDLTMPLLGNPVYFHDRNYRIIAYAEIPGMRGGNDIYNIRQNNGRMPLDAITILKDTPYFEKTFETTKPTFHVDTGECSYIYDNVRVGGEYWGRLFVDERVKSFKKGDYAIIGVLHGMIEKALSSRNLSPGSRYRFLEQKLVSMLEGRNIEMNELADELKLKGWEAGNNWFCFQLQMSDVDMLLNTKISFCDLIESKLPDCITFPFGDSIIGIVLVDSRSKTLELIKKTLWDFQLHAGVSYMFSDFGEFPLYRKQAGIALKCGIKEKNEEWVHYFEDYCFSYMLDRCVDEMLPEMLFPPALRKLIECDRRKSTNYVETLRAYLENDLKPAKAMKALFIQRSTFLYRLERINELAGIDFEDERVKAHFLIAFQLMDRSRETAQVQ